MKHQIAAGEFKAKCLHLLDEVQRSRKEILITKRGRPVARLLPVDEQPPRILGRMKDSVQSRTEAKPDAATDSLPRWR